MKTKIFNAPYRKVFSTCQKALEALNIDIENIDLKRKKITGSTGSSLLSWGEDIQIWFEIIDNETTKVTVKSTSSAQLIDWGTNLANESLIITELKNRLIPKLRKLLRQLRN